MAEKPRKPGRPAGQKAGFDRGARPGERSRTNAGGRNAGKPERGPARPRKVGGVDLSVLDRLEQEGLLTAEGRRLRGEAQGKGGGEGRGRRPEAGGSRRPEAGGSRRPEPGGSRRPEAGGSRRPEAGGPRRPEAGGSRRPEAGGPRRPEAGGPRRPEAGGPRRPQAGGSRRPDDGFGGGGGGYASVDEQLARTLARGPRRPEAGGPRRFKAGGPRPDRAPLRGAADAGFADRDRSDRYGARDQGDQGRGGARRADRPVSRPTARPGLMGRRLTAAEAEVAERLHKVMARAGVASRRHSEELIQAGRVTVNGRVVTELGTKVVAGRDIVEVDGRPLGTAESLVYLLLNKPKGYVTTLYDPEGRPKVTDLLGGDVAERVYPVGRLDYDTEGLLLLTNDGELANALMHPARLVKKTYIAKVRGVPGPAKLRALEEGIELEDGVTAPADVKMLEVKAPNAATISIRIHEGRNRQVRRMFEAVGNEVIHLRRTTLGPLHLKDLQVGQWRELTELEIRELYNSAGLRYGGKFAPKAKK